MEGGRKGLLRGWAPVGGKYLGEGATVWDGEIAGMAEALENYFFFFEVNTRVQHRGHGEVMGKALIRPKTRPRWRMSRGPDSGRLEGCHPGDEESGRTGKARTGDLIRVMREVQRRQSQGQGVRLTCVKAHVDIAGNERKGGREGQILHPGGPDRGWDQTATRGQNEGGARASWLVESEGSYQIHPS